MFCGGREHKTTTSFFFPCSSKERLKFPYDNRAGEWSLGQVKKNISRPRPLHFLGAASLFLFVISNVYIEPCFHVKYDLK